MPRFNGLSSAVLALLLTLPACAQTTPTPKSPYTALYVFGDSYSDIGAGFPYADGPTAVAYLAQRLDIPFTFYGDLKADLHTQSLDFAVSAAKTGSDPGIQQGPHALFRLGMKNQVAEFAALVHSGQVRFDPAQTMFFLAGGLNDRGARLPGCSETPAPQTTTAPPPAASAAWCAPGAYTRTNEEEEIDTLYALGARRFMVALLPTEIPAFASAGTQFNPEIARIPAEERAKHPDIRIATSDWGLFFDQVLTHPAQYGLTNTTDACAGLPSLAAAQPHCATPQTYFYYFNAHPSTAAHRAVGDLLYQESLTAP